MANRDIDDVIEMGLEVEAAEGKTPEEAGIPEPQRESEESTYVGGLEDAPVIEEDEVDLDEVLGIAPPPVAEETPPQETEEPEEQPEPQEDGRDKRIAELAEQNRRMREQLDTLVTRELKRSEAPAEEQQAPEVDQEMVDYMTPIVNHIVGPKLSEQQAATAAVVQAAQEKAMAEFIASKGVEGFSVEHLRVLKDEYDSMPDGSDDRDYYSGMAGAVMLARDLAEAGKLSVGQPKKTQSATAPLASRHRSEASGAAPRPAGNDEEERAKRIMDLPVDEINKILDSWENG